MRRFDFAVDAEPIGVVHPALDGDIDLRLVLEALNDGIAVRGTIDVPWTGVCRRCLMPLTGIDAVDIDELYQKTVIDPDAFVIEDGQLDLNPLVRETALLALDDERLCRPDCAGLCPTCGVDRNRGAAATAAPNRPTLDGPLSTPCRSIPTERRR